MNTTFSRLSQATRKIREKSRTTRARERKSENSVREMRVPTRIGYEEERKAVTAYFLCLQSDLTLQSYQSHSQEEDRLQSTVIKIKKVNL